MNSLTERLEALARGEITEEGGGTPLPDFDDQEMNQCVRALGALVSDSTKSTNARARLRPPSEAIHVIL